MNANDTCNGCFLVFTVTFVATEQEYGFLVCLSYTLILEAAGTMKPITVTKMYLKILFLSLSNVNSMLSDIINKVFHLHTYPFTLTQITLLDFDHKATFSAALQRD